jgi:predicted dehydrogenase
MALVGPGFVGVHHVEAVRRFAFVDVVAVADFSEASARQHAEALHARKAYGSYEDLVKDPDVDVVHVTTPNYLHAPVIRAALANGKHVVSEKPLAMTSTEARELLEAARAAGVVHAVTFNYRGNPMVQQVRDMVSKGAIGPVHFVHGAYLQDWLQHPTDYSWRLEPGQGGRSSAFADIGSHWCDLAQHIVGARIEAVLAELTTVVKTRLKPARSLTFSGAAADVPREEVSIASEDLGSILLRFENGAKGSVNIGQVCAGHKNDFWLEVNGRSGSLRWRQEEQNDVWFGSRDVPNQVLTKDPSTISDVARQYTHLPGGHQQGWSDAFTNLLRDVYNCVAAGGPGAGPAPAALATFADGLRAANVIDAVLESHDAGGAWTKVKA